MPRAAGFSQAPMAPNYENSYAYAAARDLIFEGESQPNGYTEPLLHDWRYKLKRRDNY